MRNPGGYALVISPVPSALQFDGRREQMRAGVFETDTFSCGHCGRITHVQPMVDAADVGALCKKCMKVVCRKCVNEGRRTGLSCDPVEAKLARWEKEGV
jgi:hypothetical protein